MYICTCTTYRWKILDVQLVLRSDGTSLLRARFVLEGTKIVIQQPTAAVAEVKVEIKSEPSNADNTSVEAMEGPVLPAGEIPPKRSIATSTEDCTSEGLVYNQRNATHVPNVFLIPFEFDGVVLLHINADKLITKKVFIYNWNKPRSEVGKFDEIDELVA